MKNFNFQIEAWIKEACSKNEVPNFSQRVKYSFSNRMTQTMGKAYYADNYILFSAPLWERATDEERKQNTIHEVCHLIAYRKYGDRGLGHKQPWKWCMKQAGRKPKVYHNVSVVKQCKVKCDCTNTILSLEKARELYNAKTICASCNTALKFKKFIVRTPK